jgi:two-component system OmpR family response regulator
MAKLMIVEDDPLLLRLYERVFTFKGFSVATAVNGEDGLVKMAKFKPDIVLLDIMMPKLDGLGVLDAMKKEKDLAKIPVIVLTNNPARDNAELAVQKGALKYLMKGDQTPAEVVEVVESALKATVG